MLEPPGLGEDLDVELFGWISWGYGCASSMFGRDELEYSHWRLPEPLDKISALRVSRVFTLHNANTQCARTQALSTALFARLCKQTWISLSLSSLFISTIYRFLSRRTFQSCWTWPLNLLTSGSDSPPHCFNMLNPHKEIIQIVSPQRPLPPFDTNCGRQIHCSQLCSGPLWHFPKSNANPIVGPHEVCVE